MAFAPDVERGREDREPPNQGAARRPPHTDCASSSYVRTSSSIRAPSHPSIRRASRHPHIYDTASTGNSAGGSS